MKTYDVVVIGSGLIGVAAAYELSKSGHTVALLDARGLSAGASTANASMLLLDGSSESVSFSICLDAIASYEQLDGELECRTGFEKLGHIALLEQESEFAAAEKASRFYRSQGLSSAILARDEVKKREPGLRTDTVLGAMYLQQWRVDPLRLAKGYFCKARQHGTDWYPHCPAEDFSVQGNRIVAIQTPYGSICGEQFVIAAGAWTRELLKKLRVTIPQYHISGAAMVCQRGSTDLRHAVYPFTSPRVAMEQRAAVLAEEQGWENMERQHANEFVVVPDANANLLVCQRSHASADYPQAVPTAYLRDMAENALRYFPGFSEAQVLRSWIAPVPFVPDGAPFFGFAKPYENLFISSGFASVLIMTPMIAKMTCAMLEGRDPGYDVAGFDPMRFTKGA